MTVGNVLYNLAPEWVLAIGACAALLVGILGRPAGRFTALFSLLCVGAALAWSVNPNLPVGEVVPGIWITPLTYYVRLITLGMGLLIVLVNWNQPEARERGEYFSMILFSLLGVLLTASANDWIVLFFAVELVSIPTYVLVGLSRDDARSSEAAIKYFFLGALSAALLVLGLVFLYGSSGTTVIQRMTEAGSAPVLQGGAAMPAMAIVGLLLALAGLAFKIAAVPLHAYIADVYEGAASPVSGMLGFVPKFAGFIALIHVMTAMRWNLPRDISWLLWVMAAATMTVGNVLALLQRNVKRMLAYSSVAHSGYMLIALLVGPAAGEGPLRDGTAALLFYIAVYGAMNLGVFALLAAFTVQGREAETLDDISGLAARAPMAALGLAVCAFSLMGLPPTAGFLGKVYIFSSAFSIPAGHAMHDAMIVLGVIGVINSAIGAAYYLRIVAVMYMGDSTREPTRASGAPIRVGLGICAAAMVILFAWPAALSRQAASATTVLCKSARMDSAKLTTTSMPE